jgi:hypothetical protein
MAKQVISKKLNVKTAEQFVYSVDQTDGYYVFAARHIPFVNGDTTPPVPTDSVSNNTIDIYDNMLFGKRVSNTDVTQMIPRYDWTAGTTYSQYDDTDSNLFSKQFYACVNTGSQHHVYKCLYNGANVPSTVEPSGTDNDAFELLNDGYIWKYMYSANAAVMSKFATLSFLPVFANASVTTAAVPGSIEVIVVEDGGAGYDNYLTGSFAQSSDLKVGGNEFNYRLAPDAEPEDDFYNGTLLFITSGPAIGEFREIVDYDGTTKVATVNAAFASGAEPAVSSSYEINPVVDVFDTGGVKQTNCIARAIANSAAANSIYKVEVIAPGSGYRSANAVILVSNQVGVSATAVLRPIISPAGGHGANVFSELGANYAGISIEFAGSDGDVDPTGNGIIRTDNDYRQVGVLKNPRFANVRISFSAGNTVGSFVPTEDVFKYKDIQLSGTVNVSATSTTVTGNSTEFVDALEVGDSILITDGASNFFGNVAAIANDTQLTISSNARFTNTEINISLLKTAAFGQISANSVGEIYVANVPATSTLLSSRFVGRDSFATTVADDIQVSRGGSLPDLRSNSFNSFTQLTKYVGTLDNGTFAEDEFVYQDSALIFDRPEARVYAAVEGGAIDFLYVTNVKNVWQTGTSNGVATGNTSEAQFTVTAKYEGELIPDSGEVLYIENISPVSRSNTQTETIKLILEF